MKIVIIDSGEENSFKNKVSDYLKGKGEVTAFYVGVSEPMHEMYARIKAANADLIVTFDDTSLMFRGELGGSSLNRIPVKMIHFVSQKEALKSFDKEEGFNLSHYVVVPCEAMEAFSQEHELIPNIAGYGEDNIPESIDFALKELWCL